jgi:hypothetical protein
MKLHDHVKTFHQRHIIQNKYFYSSIQNCFIGMKRQISLILLLLAFLVVNAQQGLTFFFN